MSEERLLIADCGLLIQMRMPFFNQQSAISNPQSLFSTHPHAAGIFPCGEFLKEPALLGLVAAVDQELEPFGDCGDGSLRYGSF